MCSIDLPSGCSLRLLEESDAEELDALIDSNRAHLSRWMPWAAEQDLAETRAFIEATRRQLFDNDGFQTAIVGDGAIIGVIGFHGVQWQQRATSIGYWLSEARQGQGTMTEAFGVLLDHAFRSWRLNRVEVRVATRNRRSQAILDRHGFHHEGTLREAEWIAGRYLDLDVYALLAREL